MIEHVYRRAKATRGIAHVIVATDDDRIAGVVRDFGGEARLTRPDHRSGTDRVAEVARDIDCDIVVNVQGDEPAVHPESIEQAVGPLLTDGVVMTTLRKALRDRHDFGSPHVVKVVVNRAGDALYFSRAPIPFTREVRLMPDTAAETAGSGFRPTAAGSSSPGLSAVEGSRIATVYKHIGLYAYRRDFLLTLASLEPTPLEQAESLEQLRALEYGYRIRVVETEYDSIGVDTPDDLERARRQLRELAVDARA